MGLGLTSVFLCLRDGVNSDTVERDYTTFAMSTQTTSTNYVALVFSDACMWYKHKYITCIPWAGTFKHTMRRFKERLYCHINVCISTKCYIDAPCAPLAADKNKGGAASQGPHEEDLKVENGLYS